MSTPYIAYNRSAVAPISDLTTIELRSPARITRGGPSGVHNYPTKTKALQTNAPSPSRHIIRILEEMSPYAVPLPPSDFPNAVLACAGVRGLRVRGPCPDGFMFCGVSTESNWRERMERATHTLRVSRTPLSPYQRPCQSRFEYVGG